MMRPNKPKSNKPTFGSGVSRGGFETEIAKTTIDAPIIGRGQTPSENKQFISPTEPIKSKPKLDKKTGNYIIQLPKKKSENKNTENIKRKPFVKLLKKLKKHLPN